MHTHTHTIPLPRHLFFFPLLRSALFFPTFWLFADTKKLFEYTYHSRKHVLAREQKCPHTFTHTMDAHLLWPFVICLDHFLWSHVERLIWGTKHVVHRDCGRMLHTDCYDMPHVPVSCRVVLPGRVPYGVSLRCMLGPQGKASRWDPCILAHNGTLMFPPAQLPASLWLCVRLISPRHYQSCCVCPLVHIVTCLWEQFTW